MAVPASREIIRLVPHGLFPPRPELPVTADDFNTLDGTIEAINEGLGIYTDGPYYARSEKTHGQSGISLQRRVTSRFKGLLLVIAGDDEILNVTLGTATPKAKCPIIGTKVVFNGADNVPTGETTALGSDQLRIIEMQIDTQSADNGFRRAWKPPYRSTIFGIRL